MTWSSLDSWIIVIGFLAAAACSLPGCYLVLRRMSLMGDAISHAVLPGLAIAFLLTSSRASWPMFLGAVVTGVLTAVLTQGIQRLGRVEATAALGIVFTTLFALGLILLRLAADKVDLDPDCVLYGAIELTPLDVVSIGSIDLPRAAIVNGLMLVLNTLFIIIFYKELKVSSFDPQLATTLGINAELIHLMLMGMVAATVVAAFESVGSILVIAMIVVPGAVGYLLTDRLGLMLILSVVVAAGCAVLGYLGARAAGTVTAGMMAVVAGGIFILALLAGPRYGIISSALTNLQLSVRIAQQDVLAMLYRVEELTQRGAMATGRVREALNLSPFMGYFTLGGLQRRGMVAQRGAEYWLTNLGRIEARGMVRTHRLWESYLARVLKMPLDHVHLSAERLEHATDRDLQRRLSERLGSPATDPHGRKIPPENL